MKASLFASILSAAASASMSFSEIVEDVNAGNHGWKASVPSKFASVEDVKPFLGTILRGEPGYTDEGLEFRSYEGEDDDIPTEFDVRTAFPECADVSGNIRDQSSCGSCWAFGSTEAFNDRHCIATGDKTKFSVEDTVANCDFDACFSLGCNGGQPGGAWRWFKSVGVVTGGDYKDIGAGDTCAPYSLAPCAHHVPATASYPECPEKGYPTPSLSKCSESGYSKSYRDDKIKATASYGLDGVKNIQADMVKYGSATAAFAVYADFPTYKSGVYKHKSGEKLGGHAVKLIGWGTENGEDYWLVANSWNEEWGDRGTFKIARGNNECGIEEQVGAGTAGSSRVEEETSTTTEVTTSTTADVTTATEATILIAGAEAASFAESREPDYSQFVCKDRKCSTECEAESYTFNDCLPVVGGGSARGVSCCDNAACTVQGAEFGLLLEVYRSDDCTGSSQRMKQPVTQCLHTSSGDKKFAKFVCGGNSSSVATFSTELHLQSPTFVEYV